MMADVGNCGKAQRRQELALQSLGGTRPGDCDVYAGTTRDLVTERISLDGIPLELMDTAGLREGLGEAEQMGIARSREALADAALVVVVLDATEPLNDEERGLLATVEVGLLLW